MKERKEFRREREKHFENADHSFTAAIYGQPVHFMENGEWKEIDNTVELGADGRYENKKNDFKVSFAGDASDEKLITVTKDGHSLSWKVRGGLKKPVHTHKKAKEKRKDMEVHGLQSKVEYKDVFDGVDLEYVLNSKTLKENIILNKMLPEGKIEFEITSELHPETKDGCVIFKTDQGEEIFVMAAPYMFDADGKTCHNIEVLCEGKRERGKALYTMILDKEWLVAEGRKWPVTIDPVISTSMNYSNIHDVRLISRYPNSQYGNDFKLIVGQDVSVGIARSLVNFDLPELHPADMVIKAVLNLTCYSDYMQDCRVHVHKVLQSWNENVVTWNTMPQYDNKIIDFAEFSDTPGLGVQFDVTEVVKDWYTNGNQYGLLLKDSQESGTYIEFLSADSDSSLAEIRPRIFIQYVNYTGIQNFWTYHSQDIRRAGQVYVNDYNGNMIYRRTLFSGSGNLMPYALELVYNSNDKDTDIGYGKGFRMNYHQKITSKTIESVSYYEWIDATGTRHYFKQDDETNKWLDELNNELELTIGTTSAEKYVISSKKDYKLIFNSSGLLVKVQDVNENTLTVTYDTQSRIVSVTDGAGRSLTVTYDQYGTITVTDPAGRSVWCNKPGDYLNGFQDYDGKTFSLEYENGLITSVGNFDSYGMDYEYTGSPARVKKIKEYAGGVLQKTLDIEYGFNINKFTDDRGRSEYYLFDNAGHTVSIKNDEGYAQVTEYMKDDTLVNKLSQVSKLQRTIPQLAKNPNLLDTDDWTGNSVSSGCTVINTNPEYVRTGTRSLKITCDSLNSTMQFYQYVRLKRGHTYTFSGYVLIESMEEAYATGGAILGVGIPVVSGDRVDFAGPQGIFNTQGEWRYIEYTFTIPENAFSEDAVLWPTVRKCMGTAYFADLQLEEGLIGSRRNLVENNDFTYDLEKFTRSTTMEDRDMLVDITALADEVPIVQSGLVNADLLNVRSGPGTSYTKVGEVTQGQIVTILETVPGEGIEWHKIAYGVSGIKIEGYVSSEYIIMFDDNVQTGTVNADVLNVRSGPGTGYTRVFQLNYGTIVTILGTATGSGYTWYHIQASYNGSLLEGYAVADYIDLITATSTGNVAVDMEEIPVNSGNLSSKVFRMIGDPSKEKRLSQTIALAGKEKDAFVISGWGAGNSVPLTDDRKFGLELEFTYTDGTKEAFWADFTGDSNQWQYVNKAVVANKDYTSMKASYVYSHNANKAYFDGLSVYKDEYWPSFTYDTDGNVVSCTDAREQETKFEYDLNNNLTNIELPTGANFTYVYGDADYPHRITEAISATGKKYAFEYDEKGNITSYKIVDSNNANNYIKYSYEYTDDFNYPERNVDYFGNSVILDYNHESGKLESVIDVNGNRTTYSYDDMGKLLMVSKEDTSSGQLTYNVQTYIYENDRVKKLQHNGMDYLFSYDAFGNVTEVKVGTQVLTANTYKMKGTQLDKTVVGNGQGVRFEYDEYDRMIKKFSVKSDGTSVLMFEYIYDNEGRLAYVIDYVNNDQIHYTYSLSGKLECIEHQNGQRFHHIYDTNDCLISIKSSGLNDSVPKAVSYEYDEDFKETKTITLGGKTMTTTYDALGRMIRQMFDITNMHATTYEYLEADDGSETPVIGLIRPGGMEFSYQYHNDGNIRQIQTPWTTENFEYDFLGQLTRVNSNDTGETILYSYDAGMNMISEEVYNYTTAGDVTGNPIRQRSFTYDSVWKDRMLTCGGKVLGYDAAGNLTSYDGTTFTWSNGRQLTGVTTPDNVNVVYTYDHNGRRVSKTVDGVKTDYYYSNGLLMRQKSATVDMQFTYDSVGNLIAVMYNGDEYYYVKNLQGDVIGLVNNQSTMVVDYSYYLWGNHRSITGQLASTLGQHNPFRYRGYYYDAETELYYVGNRYYSPELCRFICPDKTALLFEEPMKLTSKNLYSYCDNNPISKKDPNGQSAMAVLLPFVVKNAPRIIGALAGVASYIVSTLVQKEEVKFGGIVASALSGATYNIFLAATIDGAYEAFATAADDKSASSMEIFRSSIFTFGASLINIKDIPIIDKILDRNADKLMRAMIDFSTGFGDNLAVDAINDCIANQTENTDKSILYNDFNSLTNDHNNLIRIYELQYGH